MLLRPFSFAALQRALLEGWRTANATRGISIGYSLIFVLAGGLIIGGLLRQGWTPFIIAAAGAFMLIGPAILAGFFGIAQAHEAGDRPGPRSIILGFSQAAGALWALALVCGLLFMIFVTDAAILYAYMLGDVPIWLGDLLPGSGGVARFVVWSAVSGAVVAFLLFCVSVFAVPLLCERRAGLVEAVVSSVKGVFSNFIPAISWAVLLSTAVIGSVFLLPLLPLTLPWMAYASRALYREVLPLA